MQVNVDMYRFVSREFTTLECYTKCK